MFKTMFRILLLSAPLIILALSMRPVLGDEITPGLQEYQCGLQQYLGTSNIKVDKAEAFQWFLKSASLGNIDAAFNLGVMYENGDGVEKNIHQAIKWYETAAKANHTKAQFNLGQIFFSGYGVQKEVERGLSWLQKAADLGNPSAQYHVGCAYLKGNGVPKDPEMGKIWLKRSAEQGHRDAANLLSILK